MYNNYQQQGYGQPQRYGSPAGGGGGYVAQQPVGYQRVGQQNGGYNGHQSSGYNGQQNGGYNGQQYSGYNGQQNGGYSGQQSGGYNGQQNGGYNGQQSGGYNGQPPSEYNAEQPGVNSGQQSAAYNRQQPGGYNPQQPSGYNSQQSGGYNGQPLGRYNGQQSGGDTGQQPGGYYSQRQLPVDGQSMGGGYPGAGMPRGLVGVQAAPPPTGVSPNVWQWFLAVDADGSGQINVNELQQALTNADWKPFQLETCILMIQMFDHDVSGTINAQEFQQLMDFIERWRNCFQGFDSDQSGTIGAQELSAAFQAFGYRLSPQFAQICVQKYDKERRGTINLESFIQACVLLQNLTEAFKRKDVGREGRAQLDYQSYVEITMDVALHRLGRT